MADFPPAPRVNQGFLGQFVGKPVTLVGKVISASGGNVTLETSDGGNMAIAQVPGEATPAAGTVIEILGTANASSSVDAIRMVDLGADFKLPQYEKLVQAIHGQHKAIFQ